MEFRKTSLITNLQMGGEKKRTYRAAVHQWLDKRIIVVRHFLVVGAQEAQRLVVAVGLGVVPGHRLMTVVGEVLPSRGAQQLQEGHLHWADGILCHIDIVQLGGRWREGEKSGEKWEGNKRSERRGEKQNDKNIK